MQRHWRVFYVEEPVFDTESPFLEQRQELENLWVFVPHINAAADERTRMDKINHLLQEAFADHACKNCVLWYYTPMALDWATCESPKLVVFDCMDELAAFKNAPEALRQREAALMEKADLVFTGGISLYEARKDRHAAVHLFPSSIDKAHFGKARSTQPEFADQQYIPHPRIGFFGVIDERLDIELLREMAAMKPEWQFILIGPVVKIDPAHLPQAPNIHYHGQKLYADLPGYIAHWDVAIMPFAMNESTRFISPTKTPEYLAAGKPVVSTPILDVIREYGAAGLVQIASSPEAFVAAIERALEMSNDKQWLAAVDAVLAEKSWDLTVDRMIHLIEKKLGQQQLTTKKEDEYV